VGHAPHLHGGPDPVGLSPSAPGLRQPVDPPDGDPPGVDASPAAGHHQGAVVQAGVIGRAGQRQPVLLAEVAPPGLDDPEGPTLEVHGAGAEVRVGPVHPDRPVVPDLPDHADQPLVGDDGGALPDAVGRAHVEEEHALRAPGSRAEDAGGGVLGLEPPLEVQEPPEATVLLGQRRLVGQARRQGVPLGHQLVALRRLHPGPGQGLLEGDEGTQDAGPQRRRHLLLAGSRQVDHDQGQTEEDQGHEALAALASLFRI